MPSAIIENLDLKKPSFRPSKWPRKLKPAKNSKLPKLPENCFEPVGKGGWPPISTWINNFSSEEEMPRRQDKPLKKPRKALKKKLKTKEVGPTRKLKVTRIV
jgi:hypothetical protein